MAYGPIYGCSGCQNTAGRMGCPDHGITRLPAVPHCPTCKCINTEVSVTAGAPGPSVAFRSFSILILLVIAAALSGCSLAGWFTKEPETITLPLQPTRNVLALFDQVQRKREQYLDALCAKDELKASHCRALQASDAEISKAISVLDVKVTHPKAELDVEKIMRLLEAAGKLVP